MKSYFNLKIQSTTRYWAFWGAFMVTTLVTIFFISYENYLNFSIVFIISTLALDFIFLLFCFYTHARFIIILYVIIFFSISYLMGFDMVWLIDYAEFTFNNLLNTSGYFPITGYILYHLTEDCVGAIDFFFGPHAFEIYYYYASSHITYFFLSIWAFCYIWIAGASPYFAVSLILFTPLLAALAVGFFGKWLGTKYSGYLTTGATGFGAFGALYLWLIHPILFNTFYPQFLEFFKQRAEFFAQLYNKALRAEEKILTDDVFAAQWRENNHADTLEIGFETFKMHYDLAALIDRFSERYTPFNLLRDAQDAELTISFGKMFKFYSLDVNWLFKFDNLSLTAAFTVLFISFLVHLYSCDYMANDAHPIRFFAFLSMFTFFMVMLVLSANMVVFYIAWEGVGLCSFLLISFWFTRAQANKAAVKALLVNKIGDVFLLVAAAHTFNMCKSLDFYIIFSVAPIVGQTNFSAFLGLNEIDVLCLLLLVAALVKSAQLFFHIWLADAMEGPTPVSALLHAATMVTAGVFLVIRFSFVFEYSPLTLLAMVYVGVATTIFSGIVGLFQYDIKKIIAYSTCSQLGLMFIACGLSGYTLALFHFFNHAFFKALLFLAAGVLIHALKNEQDIRKMGGLRKLFPFTYTVFLIGSLSLAGFPFFSGYFSKDAIIALAYAKFVYSGGGFILFYLILFSLFLTCFYSFRLVFYVFFGDKTNLSKHLHNACVKEHLNLFIIIPLTILSIFSVVSGACFKDYFIGIGSNFYYSASVFSMAEELKYFMFFKEQKLITLFILIMSYLACSLFAYYYKDSTFLNKPLHHNKFFRNIFIFFNKKGFFDDIYNLFISSKLFKFGYDVFLKWDKGLLEYFGPTGIYATLRKISFRMKAEFNRGPIVFLIRIMLLGVVIILVVGLLF